MDIDYIGPGEPLTADRWNNFFAAASQRIALKMNNLSLLLVAGETGYRKKFFFFSVANPPQASMHPLGYAYIKNHVTENLESGFLRQYNHAAITSVIDNCPPAPSWTSTTPIFSAEYGVCRLLAPDFSIWAQSLYPEKEYGNYPSAAGCAAGYVPNLNCCLSVLKRTVAGRDYNISIAPTAGAHDISGPAATGEYGNVDRVHPHEGIEIILLGSIGFDSAWDKYNIFRIHNFGTAQAIVTFTGHAIAIAPGACACVRRRLTGGTYAYTDGYAYFQKMLPQDPRFFDKTEITEYNAFSIAARLAQPVDPSTGLPVTHSNNCNLFTPVQAAFTAINILRNPRPNNPEGNWRIEDIYCTDYDAKHPLEQSSPPGGWFGDPSDATTAIGDLLIHKGYFLVARNGQNQQFPANNAFNFFYGKSVFFSGIRDLPRILAQENPVCPPAGQTFPPPLAGAAANAPGINWQVNSGGQIELSAGIIQTGTGMELIDLSTNLISFLLGSVYVKVGTAAGNGASYAPNVLTTKGTMNRRTNLVPKKTTTNIANQNIKAIHLWDDFTGIGLSIPFYATDGFSAVTFDNYTYEIDPTNYTSSGAGGTGSTLKNYTLTDPLSILGDFIQEIAGAVINANNVQFLMTVFGPMMTWDETYNLNAYFAKSALDTYTSTPFLQSNFISLKIDPGSRTVTVKKYFPLASGFNNPFPESQFFSGWYFSPLGSVITTPLDTAAVRWQWPRIERAYSSPRKVTFTGKEPWNPRMTGSYSIAVPPNLKNWFETQPVSQDAAGLEQPCYRKFQVARLGKTDADPDIMSVMAQWAAGEKSPSAYQCALGAWIYAKGGAPNFGNHPLQLALQAKLSAMTSQTLCEMENYNTLASLVNGCQDTKQPPPFIAPDASFTFPAYNPNNVGLPNGQGLSGVFPRDCYFSWLAPTSGPDAQADYFTSLGVPHKTAANLPDGFGIAILDQHGYIAGGGPQVGDPNYDNSTGLPIWIGSTPVTAVIGGWDDAWAAQVTRYRWITIDAARDYLTGVKIPFKLNNVIVPLRYSVATANISLSTYQSYAGPDTFTDLRWIEYTNFDTYPHLIPIVQPPPPIEITDPGIFFGPSFGIFGNGFAPFKFSPLPTTFGIRQVSFVSDSAGNFAIKADPANLQIRKVKRPPQGAFSFAYGGKKARFVFNHTEIEDFGQSALAFWDHYDFHRQKFSSYHVVRLDYGLGERFTGSYSVVEAVVILIEGVSDQALVIRPKNYAQPDLNFQSADENVIAAQQLGSGVPITPTLVKNNLEITLDPIATIIDGAGQIGYGTPTGSQAGRSRAETVITYQSCGFENSVLELFDVDGKA